MKFDPGCFLSLSSLNPFVLQHRMLWSIILLRWQHVYTPYLQWPHICVFLLEVTSHLRKCLHHLSASQWSSEKYHQFCWGFFLARRRPGMKETLLLSGCSVQWSLQKVPSFCWLCTSLCSNREFPSSFPQKLKEPSFRPLQSSCCVLLVYKFFGRKTKWRWKVA